MTDGSVFQLCEIAGRRAESGRDYLEFLRVPTLSAGWYELATGAQDPQQPHERDELYHVVRGRAMIRIDDERSAVGPGSVIYVRAGVPHRFEEIEEDLSVLVVFTEGASV